MKVTDFQPILDMISAARDGRILVVTHERPDGDAVGSAAGLRLLLQENGCTADVLFPDDLPDAYRGFVPEDMTKEQVIRATNMELRELDLKSAMKVYAFAHRMRRDKVK